MYNKYVVATPVIPAVWRKIQEDHEFEASLGYIVRPYLKQQQQKPQNQTNKIKCETKNKTKI
jgi:hypothetical protein